MRFHRAIATAVGCGCSLRYAAAFAPSLGRTHGVVRPQPTSFGGGSTRLNVASVQPPPPQQQQGMSVDVLRETQVTGEGAGAVVGAVVGEDVAMFAAEAGPKKKKRKGKEANIRADGDTLEDLPYMRRTVAATFVFAAAVVANVLMHVTSPMMAAQVAAASVAGVLAADLFTGFLHFGVDNFGDKNTPVLGTIIDAFQGHHDTPWTITHRPFCNNVHKVAYVVLPLMTMIVLGNVGPMGTIFGVGFCMGNLMCQELHKQAHQMVPTAPWKQLQSLGVILPKSVHGKHHQNPFSSNYCIVTGTFNPLLDGLNTWRYLENVVFKLTGVEPNTWKNCPATKAESLALF